MDPENEPDDDAPEPKNDDASDVQSENDDD